MDDDSDEEQTSIEDGPSDSNVAFDERDAGETRVENLRQKSGRSAVRSYSILVGEKTDGQKKDEGKTTTNENEEQARVTL